MNRVSPMEDLFNDPEELLLSQGDERAKRPRLFETASSVGDSEDDLVDNVDAAQRLVQSLMPLTGGAAQAVEPSVDWRLQAQDMGSAQYEIGRSLNVVIIESAQSRLAQAVTLRRRSDAYFALRAYLEDRCGIDPVRLRVDHVDGEERTVVAPTQLLEIAARMYGGVEVKQAERVHQKYFEILFRSYTQMSGDGRPLQSFVSFLNFWRQFVQRARLLFESFSAA